MRMLLPLVVVVLVGAGLWFVLGDDDGGEREVGVGEGDYSGARESGPRDPGMGAEASSASRVAIADLPTPGSRRAGDESWREGIIRLKSAGGGLRGEAVVKALAGVIPIRFVNEADRTTLYQRTLVEEGMPPEIPAGELLMLLEQGGFIGQQIGDKLWIRALPKGR